MLAKGRKEEIRAHMCVVPRVVNMMCSMALDGVYKCYDPLRGVDMPQSLGCVRRRLVCFHFRVKENSNHKELATRAQGSPEKACSHRC